MLYHAHVQHPRGSGYMMQSGAFHNVEEALTRYLELVDADNNPFGRNALERYSDSIRVLLIPAELRGPDAMAYTGFCDVWNEDGSDAYETEEPAYVPVPNPRYKG
ncbi:hypothetical protein LCGC14_0289570 [marine sediment metagenome]|uniref:Uncharacterized protein n=1 Tax=marine sediment metagenome TaxID=412755 RepID=A0A0F9TTW8_9ZZZZ